MKFTVYEHCRDIKHIRPAGTLAEHAQGEIKPEKYPSNASREGGVCVCVRISGSRVFGCDGPTRLRVGASVGLRFRHGCARDCEVSFGKVGEPSSLTRVHSSGITRPGSCVFHCGGRMALLYRGSEYGGPRNLRADIRTELSHKKESEKCPRKMLVITITT